MRKKTARAVPGRRKGRKWKVVLAGGALILVAAALSPGGEKEKARTEAYQAAAPATKAKIDAKEQKALRKDLNAELHGAFTHAVPNDATGSWRIYIMRSEKTGAEVAADYYRAYFEDDGEIHFLINKKLGTTTCLKYMAGQIFADEYGYADKSEKDAKALLTGGILGSYMIDPATGAVEDLNASEDPDSGDPGDPGEEKSPAALRAELDARVGGTCGEPIGGRKTYYVSTDEESAAFALDYYNAYFENDEEVHYIINEGLGTSAKIEVLGDDLFLSVNPYQGRDGAPGLGQYTVSRKTGKVQDLSKPDLPPEEEEEEKAPSKKMVKKAQKYLKKAGYYDGDATGKLNKATKKAVKKYRKAAGLPVSTEIDDELISSLKSENFGLPAATEPPLEVIDIMPEATATPVPTEPPVQELAAAGGEYPFEDYGERQTADTWVLNTESMKIHHPGCRKVSEIAPENYATSNLTIGELEAMGYTKCMLKGDFGK